MLVFLGVLGRHVGCGHMSLLRIWMLGSAGSFCAVLLLAVSFGLGGLSLAGAQAEGELTAEEQSAEARYAVERFAMVQVIAALAARTSSETGIAEFDQRVLHAMNKVPRHLFVPDPLRSLAYHNSPLPLGYGQNISQPFIIALMTHLMAPEPGDVIYETGTGAGYQAAIFIELGAQVYSVEIIAPLAEPAAERLVRLGYGKVSVKRGDGYDGWPDHAPYDGILIKEALDHVPKPLLDQLKPGGRLVLPLGPQEGQHLTVIEKRLDGSITKIQMLPVRFSAFQGGRRT